MRLNEWEMLVKCNGDNIGITSCGVHFHIRENDVKFQIKSKVARFYVVCPCCCATTKLNECEIPEEIKESAIIKYQNKNGTTSLER